MRKHEVMFADHNKQDQLKVVEFDKMEFKEGCVIYLREQKLDCRNEQEKDIAASLTPIFEEILVVPVVRLCYSEPHLEDASSITADSN